MPMTVQLDENTNNSIPKKNNAPDAFFWGVVLGIGLGGIVFGFSAVAAYKPVLLAKGLAFVRDKTAESLFSDKKASLPVIPRSVIPNPETKPDTKNNSIDRTNSNQGQSNQGQGTNTKNKRRGSGRRNVAVVRITPTLSQARRVARSNPADTIRQYQVAINTQNYRNAWSLLDDSFKDKKQLSYSEYVGWWKFRKIQVKRIISVESSNNVDIEDRGDRQSKNKRVGNNKTAIVNLVWNNGHRFRLYESRITLKYSEQTKIWKISNIKNVRQY